MAIRNDGGRAGEQKSNGSTGSIKQVVVAVVIALLVGGSSPWWWHLVFPPRPKSCPNIEGQYRSKYGWVISISQTKCHIIGSYSTPAGYTQEMKGDWEPQNGYFSYNMMRTNLKTKRQTNIFGKIGVPNKSQIEMTPYGSDGKDDLPVDYDRKVLWSKQ